MKEGPFNPNLYILLQLIGTSVFFAFSYAELFNWTIFSLILISTSFILTIYTALRIEKRRPIIAAIVMLAVIPSLYLFLTNQNSVLLWDPKGMANIAQHVAETGQIPARANQIYPFWYVQYPASLILLGFLSTITSIPVQCLMIFPVVTSALLILLVWVMLDISKMSNLSPLVRCVAICIPTLAFLIPLNLLGVFLYQNFAVIMFMVVLYLLLRNPIMNRPVTSKQIIIMLPLLLTMISSNLDAVVDIIITMVGLLIFAIVNYRRKIKYMISVSIFASIALLASLIYMLMVTIDSTKSFSYQIAFAISNLIHPQVQAGLAQYHLHDFMPLENLFLALSLIGVALLAVLWLAYDTYSFIANPTQTIPITYVVLLVSGLYALTVAFVAPYGTTTSSKVVAPVAAVMSSFFLESSAKMKLRRHFPVSRLLARVSFVVVILSLPGFFVLVGYSGYFSPVNTASYKYASMLSQSSLDTLINSSPYTFLNSSQKLIVIDSPTVPAYFIYGFTAPRIPLNWQTIEVNPSITTYNLRLLNGLFVPRKDPVNLVLLLPISSMLVGSPADVQSITDTPNIVYSNAIVCLAITG